MRPRTEKPDCTLILSLLLTVPAQTCSQIFHNYLLYLVEQLLLLFQLKSDKFQKYSKWEMGNVRLK